MKKILTIKGRWKLNRRFTFSLNFFFFDSLLSTFYQKRKMAEKKKTHRCFLKIHFPFLTFLIHLEKNEKRIQ